MTRYAPLWQQEQIYSAQLDRQLIDALWPLGGYYGAAITLSSSTMGVNIGAGVCAVQMTPSTQGCELCWWDATETTTLAAAPAAGNSRIDLVICQVHDDAVDSGGVNNFVFSNVTGTPTTGTPVAPATPNNALAIAQVTVPGNVTNLSTATWAYSTALMTPPSGGGDFGGTYGNLLQATANVEAIIRANSINQLALPTAAINCNSQRLTQVAMPAANTDAMTALNMLLGATYYEPGTSQSKTSSSTTLAAIDTTNLTLSFTAISTIVVVELQALVGFFAGTTGANIYWALFTHNTTTQVGYTTSAGGWNAAYPLQNARVYIRVTGLTAGTAYQWDWAWAVGSSSDTALLAIQTGTGASTQGPAIMRAYSG